MRRTLITPRLRARIPDPKGRGKLRGEEVLDNRIACDIASDFPTQIVETVKADLGVLFQNDGERLAIVDEQGALIEGDKLLVLFAVLVARTHELAVFCLSPPYITSCSELLRRK